MPTNLSPSEPDLYSDAAPAETPAEAPETGESSGDSKDSSTALLPATFLGSDVKPGDTCSVTVVRVHDDQVEVKYSKAGKEEEGDEESDEMESEPEAAPAPEGEMAAMME